MAAPLRKIMRLEEHIISSGRTSDGDYIGEPVYSWREVLECGHRVSPKVDIYGETLAYRRRCKQCEKEGRS